MGFHRCASSIEKLIYNTIRHRGSSAPLLCLALALSCVGLSCKDAPPDPLPSKAILVPTNVE